MKIGVANIEAMNQPLLYVNSIWNCKNLKKDDDASCGDINVIFSFSIAYNHFKAHKMLAIMFDPHFKTMKYIQNSMGNSIIVKIVVKYNVNIVCHFLLQVYTHSNLVKEPT
jgi:hypothetical protein